VIAWGNYVHISRIDNAYANMQHVVKERKKERIKMTNAALMEKYPRDVAVFSDPQEGVKQGYQLLQVLGVQESQSGSPFGMNPFIPGQTKLQFLMGRDVSTTELMAEYTKNYEIKIKEIQTRLDEAEEELTNVRATARQTTSDAVKAEEKVGNLQKSNRRLRTQVAGLKKQLEDLENLDGEVKARAEEGGD